MSDCKAQKRTLTATLSINNYYISKKVYKINASRINEAHSDSLLHSTFQRQENPSVVSFQSHSRDMLTTTRQALISSTDFHIQELSAIRICGLTQWGWLYENFLQADCE